MLASAWSVATAGLTTLAGIVIGLGGIAGYYGAVVSTRSDRRLKQFLEDQERDITTTLEDGPQEPPAAES